MRRRDWIATVERILATGAVLLAVLLVFALFAAPSMLVQHAAAVRDRIGLAGVPTEAVTAGLMALAFGSAAIVFGLVLSDRERKAWSVRWEWHMVRFVFALIGCVACAVVAWALA